MQNAIELSDLRFRWPGASRPVIDIDRLSLNSGEKLFLRGASGSGKTTLLSLVAGINTPVSGDVKILDTHLASLSHSQRDQFRADNIGFIFQMFNLIPYLNVLDNVTLPYRFSNKRKLRGNAQAAPVEATRLLSHLGLDNPELLHSPITALSVGQQQRVAAARALIGHPSIVIADEPTSALDTDSRGQFIELLMRECSESGAALLFVSHDNSLAHYFDRQVDLAEINRAQAGIV